MSYILDALRRADSERERGGVPSLHSKPVSAALADADDDDEGRRMQPLWWAVIALSVVLAGVLAWLFLRDGPREREAAPVLAVQADVLVASQTPPPVPQVKAAQTAAEATAQATAQATVPPPAPVRDTPPPTRPLQAARAEVPAAPAPAPATTAQPKPARTTKPAVAASAPAEAKVYALSELPESIRRELPQLTVSGAMYSRNAANRMLILNGQVFHEGDKVTPELTLEEIKLKAAVLSYKGYRYGINY